MSDESKSAHELPPKEQPGVASEQVLVDAPDSTEDGSAHFKRGFGFWAVISALCAVSILASLENSVIVTAGPYIAAELDMGDTYIWISNAFFVTSAAVQPLCGQLCNVFGRRWVMLTGTAIFTLGSGICGGASNGPMLIAGRALQGAGSGGAVMLCHIILADIVPLRQRGYYLAILLSFFAAGMALGPVIGGAFAQRVTWRWAFYINLPFGGLSLALLYFFLHLNYNKDLTLRERLMRIDWVGNLLIMAGTVSMLYALAVAGSVHPWTSWRSLVPLLLGALGLVLFAVWEASGKQGSQDLVMPPRLFQHRTSWIVAICTFLHWMLLYWALYFMPVWFQSVLLFSPERTGVAILPLSLVSIPGSAVAAIIVARWGRFKALHIVGETLFTVGLGLFAVLSESSSTAAWVLIQSLGAIGAGLIMDTQLPAFQAPVPESDQASATSTWTFIRTVGGVWGVAIPATIFNNRLGQLAHTITDPQVRSYFEGGSGYQYASAEFIRSFPDQTQAEIRDIYQQALRLVFLASIAFGGTAAVLAWFERDVKLRQNLETDFGLVNAEVNQDEKKVNDTTS